MALNIFWSEQAVDKLDSIIEFLEEEWGENSVRLFIRNLYDFLDILQEFPEIGSIENKELEIRAFVIMKQLTLYYQIRDNAIILLNFCDNRQQPKKKKF